MERFFGGSPGLVLLRLAILSLIVGVLLSALGLSPYDIIESFRQMVARIYNMGFDAVEWAFRYFLLGAVIVVPIWFISRIFKVMGQGGERPSGSLDRKPRDADL